MLEHQAISNRVGKFRLDNPTTGGIWRKSAGAFDLPVANALPNPITDYLLDGVEILDSVGSHTGKIVLNVAPADPATITMPVSSSVPNPPAQVTDETATPVTDPNLSDYLVNGAADFSGHSINNISQDANPVDSTVTVNLGGLPASLNGDFKLYLAWAAAGGIPSANLLTLTAELLVNGNSVGVIQVYSGPTDVSVDSGGQVLVATWSGNWADINTVQIVLHATADANGNGDIYYTAFSARYVTAGSPLDGQIVRVIPYVGKLGATLADVAADDALASLGLYYITDGLDKTAIAPVADSYTKDVADAIPAVKVKTDNLPADPATQTTAAAIQTKTDNLPADPASQAAVETAITNNPPQQLNVSAT